MVVLTSWTKICLVLIAVNAIILVVSSQSATLYGGQAPGLAGRTGGMEQRAPGSPGGPPLSDGTCGWPHLLPVVNPATGNTICTDCGSAGEPACSDGTCDVDAHNVGGTCMNNNIDSHENGVPGQAANPDGNTCNLGVAVWSPGVGWVCRSCGYYGMQSCDGNCEQGIDQGGICEPPPPNWKVWTDQWDNQHAAPTLPPDAYPDPDNGLPVTGTYLPTWVDQNGDVQVGRYLPADAWLDTNDGQWHVGPPTKSTGGLNYPGGSSGNSVTTNANSNCAIDPVTGGDCYNANGNCVSGTCAGAANEPTVPTPYPTYTYEPYPTYTYEPSPLNTPVSGVGGYCFVYQSGERYCWDANGNCITGNCDRFPGSHPTITATVPTTLPVTPAKKSPTTAQTTRATTRPTPTQSGTGSGSGGSICLAGACPTWTYAGVPPTSDYSNSNYPWLHQGE